MTNVFPLFKGHQLRSVKLDGEPWFVAADACRCLHMDPSKGTYKWLVTLDPDEKARTDRREHPQIFCGSQAGSQTIISRPGLFKLIARSSKPAARAARRPHLVAKTNERASQPPSHLPAPFQRLAG